MLFARRVASGANLRRVASAPAGPQPFPCSPVPYVQRPRFIPPWSSAPSESCSSSHRPTWFVGFAFLGFDALQRHPPASSVWRAGRSRPAPAPLSRFLSASAACASVRSTALFRAATVTGLRSLEPSPTRGRLPLSGQPVPPCGHPPACKTRPPRPCHRRFPPTPSPLVLALQPARRSAPILLPTPPSGTCSPVFPADYELPFLSRSDPRFHADRPDPLPFALGHGATLIARSAGFIRFAALIPLRVRSARPGRPDRVGRCSIRFPFRDQTQHGSEPSNPRARSARRLPPCKQSAR